MRSLIYALFFLFFSAPLLGQNGNYFLSHYESSDDRSDNVCFAIAQDYQGILYFATKTGILQFDGRNWNELNGNGAVYTLSNNITGDIFWGGANGYGKIAYDESGFIQNQKLSSGNVKDVFQSIVTSEKVYFLSDKALFIYSKTDGKTIEIKSNNTNGSFTCLFELYGNVYVNAESGGVFNVDQNKLIKSKIDWPETEILFSTHFDNTYLVGGLNNRLYVCSQKFKFKEINLEDQAYIDAGVVVSASWINKQLIALGTLRGGVIFINPVTGKTKELVNYNTGLPDNEVFAMMSDRNQNIWIAHDYGFTRVAPYLPMHSFDHYNGLKGNLLCAISFREQVYVGTSLGLFKLDKEEVYDEITYYEDVKIVDNKKSKEKDDPGETPPVNDKVPEIQVESKKTGFFNFLKRKKKPETNKNEKIKDEIKEERVVKESNAPTEKSSFLRRKTKSVKVTQRVLRSSQYVYKKVAGIDAKITQLIEVQGKLLATGLGGAFDVTGLQSKPLLEEPVRFVFANKDVLLASTYQDEIRAWSLTGSGWQRISLLKDLEDEITFIFEGAKDELWLCGLDKIYKLEISGFSLKKIQRLVLPGANPDESVGIQYKGKTLIVNSTGFFAFDRTKNQMVKIDTLPKPHVYFAGSKSLWYRDTHGWNLLGSTPGHSNLQLLNLFQDLRFITSDHSSNNLWLITGNNELIKFFGEKLRPYEAGYPLIVKSIRNGENKISSQTKIKIDERQSALSVEVVQPDYISAHSMEYRYFLKGLHKSWSEWSDNNNVVDFPYLPQGKYTLQIQSKDIFGKISEIESMTLNVQPPYWQRPWFYALEFALFAMLVGASFRLSSRYAIVSRILSLLTIILLIQFIQTIINNYFATTTSPVIDFFLQVVVALLILPVEGVLRRFMVRSIDATEIYHFIKKKKDGREVNKKATP